VLPSILALTPGAGSAGDQIEISGGGFTNVTGVRFNGVADAGFVVESSTRISAHIPAGAQTGHVTVSTLAGSTSSPRSLLVLPAIDSFTPSSSSAGGHVTISGRSFLGATSVKIGGVGAGFHIDSPTRITATVPSNAGTGPISITSAGGTATSTDALHILPRLSSFSPASGKAGAAVTLYGSGLANATSVRFNGVDATITSDTATQVKVLAPAVATTGPITITTPEGTAASSASFKVLPSILALTPGAGSAGDQIEISGGGFTNVTGVRFNGVADAGFVVESSTRISGHIPAGAQTGHVTVSTLAGSSSSPRSLLVLPSIDSFTPSSSSAGGHVTISGRSFLGATSVKIGGVGAGFHIDSPTRITATVPSNAGTGPISITSAGGTATSTDALHILPRLSSFSPASGKAGAAVTLYGSGLANATSVRFNGVDATITSDTATQVKVLAPAAATTGPITITTPEGTAASSASFKVLPSILALTPGAGSAGDEIEISGGGFTNVTGVRFNGVADAGFVVESSTRISGHIPAGAQTGHVTVSTLAGSSSSPRSLLVLPSIDSFTPSSSSAGGHVTISGRSFLGATSVKIGGVGAGFHIDSPTRITATVPSNAGTGPISITSAGGTATSTDALHILPRLSSFSPASGKAGAAVTLYGSGLANATSVRFNGVDATITSDTATQVKVLVPTGATSGLLTVTTAEGIASSARAFTIG
jgi:ribosomal protein S12